MSSPHHQQILKILGTLPRVQRPSIPCLSYGVFQVIVVWNSFRRVPLLHSCSRSKVYLDTSILHSKLLLYIYESPLPKTVRSLWIGDDILEFPLRDNYLYLSYIFYIPGGKFISTLSDIATDASVINKLDDTDNAFSNANLVTIVGSIIPTSFKLQNTPF